MERYRNLVWDWNGTLLDDLETGVMALDDMLERRHLPACSVREYKDRFGFPVLDFYAKVGFDLQKEDFHVLSEEFVETYDSHADRIRLTAGVRDVLEKVSRSGIRQYVLSALREDLLLQMLGDYGIRRYFDGVCGSDNIYAAGKLDRGRQLVHEHGLESSRTLMVGDTLHDHEVAEALGFGCVLYAGGHNSSWRLSGKAPVISDMQELLGVLDL